MWTDFTNICVIISQIGTQLHYKCVLICRNVLYNRRTSNAFALQFVNSPKCVIIYYNLERICIGKTFQFVITNYTLVRYYKLARTTRLQISKCLECAVLRMVFSTKNDKEPLKSFRRDIDMMRRKRIKEIFTHLSHIQAYLASDISTRNKWLQHT